MAATKMGVVYNTVTGEAVMIIIPDHDSQLETDGPFKDTIATQPGCALHHIDVTTARRVGLKQVLSAANITMPYYAIASVQGKIDAQPHDMVEAVAP